MRLSGDAYFWSKVERSDLFSCWEWHGYTNAKGYGRVHMPGPKVLAHRYAYESRVEPIPVGMDVCHHCDNRRCVNPSHLFVGTHIENNLDRHRKGRSAGPRGERAPSAKLTETDVVAMRQRYAERPVSYSKLGREFGVSSNMARLIITGKNWRHLLDRKRYQK